MSMYTLILILFTVVIVFLLIGLTRDSRFIINGPSVGDEVALKFNGKILKGMVTAIDVDKQVIYIRSINTNKVYNCTLDQFIEFSK